MRKTHVLICNVIKDMNVHDCYYHLLCFVSLTHGIEFPELKREKILIREYISNAPQQTMSLVPALKPATMHHQIASRTPQFRIS